MTHQESQSLGEILTGEVTLITDYEANLFKNEYCKVLCKKLLTDFDIDVLKWMVDEDYVSSWFLDDLPAGRNMTMYGEISDLVMHDSGIPVGAKHSANGQEKKKIFNHFTFNVFVNKDPKSKMNSIVEFSIVPFR
jgi:transmembrane 9 superfamily protein 2/4